MKTERLTFLTFVNMGVERGSAISGMEKIVSFDQSQSLDDCVGVPETNSARTPHRNGVVTFSGNIRKKV